MIRKLGKINENAKNINMSDHLKYAIEEIDAAIEYFSIRGEYHGSTKYSEEWRTGWEYASMQALQSLKLIKLYIESELENVK